MNYLSVKETAAQWGVSAALVRRYCKEGRIPKAILKETGWQIPTHARKPGSEVVVVEKKTELPPLARKLQNQKKLEDLLDFHVRLERIFPFEDYNGRVGRLILFKECLRHGVMPFILDDKRRGAYLEGLRKWDEDRTVLFAVTGEAQARFEHQIDQHILLAQGKRFAPRDSADENEE